MNADASQRAIRHASSLAALTSIRARLVAVYEAHATPLLLGVAVLLCGVSLVGHTINRYTEVGASNVGQVVSLSFLANPSSSLFPVTTNPIGFMTLQREDPQTIVETTTSRFVVDQSWSGLAGEDVVLRQMRNGDFYLCGVQTDCALVVQSPSRP